MPDNRFAHLPDVWQRCISLFLDQVEGISGSTESRRNYSYRLVSFFSVPGKACDLYSRAEVIEWLNRPNSPYSRRAAGQPVGPAGYNARLTTLVSLYKFAAGYEVDGEPLLSKKPPVWGIKYRKTGHTCRSLSEAELERFFTAVGDGTTVKSARDFALMVAYFYSGRRRAELCAIRWKDFTETTFIEENGQERPGILYEFTSKGRSRSRQRAEMPGPAWDAIQHYLRLSGRLESIQPDDPIFVSVESGHPHKDDDNPYPPLNGHYCNTLFRLICKKANIDTSRGLTLHSLRHSAALCRLRAGCTLESIRKFLGHSSIAVTARYCETIQTPGDSDAARLTERLPFLSRPALSSRDG